MEKTLFLFTDGSVNPQLKIGYGACLCLSDPELPLDILKKQIKVQGFEQTSSTKLELQTLLWALRHIEASGKRVIICTDSQNISKLPERRKKLEQNNYISERGKVLKHAQLYQEFYQLTENFDYKIEKLQGHQVSDKRNHMEKIFSLVDRKARRALREALGSNF